MSLYKQTLLEKNYDHTVNSRHVETQIKQNKVRDI